MTVQVAELQVRRGSAALWAATNPVLLDGEWGKDDAGRLKLGDGVTPWNALSVANARPATVRANVTGATALAVPPMGGSFADTLTGNTTYSAPTGALAGIECAIDLKLTQDNAGSHTVTWFAGITWLQGIPPVIPLGANLSLFVSFVSLDGGATWLGSYASTQGEWRKDIMPFLGFTTTQGTWTYSEAVGQVLGSIANSSGLSGDNISFVTSFEAGTWTLDLLTITFNSRGIVVVSIDGVQVASFDQYTAAAVNNIKQTQAGIVIPTSGKHTISFTSTTKNAGSSGFGICLSLITLSRTA